MQKKSKTCTRCGAMLPLTEFSPCSHGECGRYSRCKRCQALISRIRRAQGDGSREAQRRWRDLHRADASAAAQRWKQRHPARERAHYAVRAAVLGGLLRRPERCEGCGRAARVVAHHTDYARPLEVEWLCRWCHARRHVDLRLNRETDAA